VKLSEEYKIRLIKGIAAGMFHLHRYNIVHRDLAARNILLSKNGDPRISVLFVFLFHLIGSFQTNSLFFCVILI
jgi:serine/threonine protein kinase